MGTNVKELLSGGLSDARLEILRWANDGEDIVLGIRKPNSESRLMVRLVWVTRLLMSIDFGQYAGSPLIFGSRLESLPHGRWAVEIEFCAAPEGRMSCECNEIRLDDTPPPS